MLFLFNFLIFDNKLNNKHIMHIYHEIFFLCYLELMAGKLFQHMTYRCGVMETYLIFYILSKLLNHSYVCISKN